MSKSRDQVSAPRSTRHKQILAVAADNPDASLEVIASKVVSATPDLVERVLEEYENPVQESLGPADELVDEPSGSSDSLPDPDDFSPEQREILRAIYEHPHATQRELGEQLNVSRTTVGNRANSVEGFKWKHRGKFVEAVFEGESTASERHTTAPSSTTGTHETGDEQLVARISALEREVEALSTDDTTRAVFDDLDLVHKVIHACMASDTVTEEDELVILQALVE